MLPLLRYQQQQEWNWKTDNIYVSGDLKRINPGSKMMKNKCFYISVHIF